MEVLVILPLTEESHTVDLDSVEYVELDNTQ